MKTGHDWSKDALFAKAQLYAEAMEDSEELPSRFGLHSALALEFLIRAAVAATSPALLSDTSDWNNILYGLGLGHKSKKQRFVPKSAPITELISRLEELSPTFNREHANFCAGHFARRNAEVHTGELPYENTRGSSWLPGFYSACEILVEIAGETLDTLFSESVAQRAREDIEALRDETAKSVLGTLNAHKMVWEQKSDEDKAIGSSQADTASIRQLGHRVKCPACGCTALLYGKAVGVTRQSIDESGIVERQTMKPESFNCIACGLKISGYSKLLVLGLGDTFISTSNYDAVEYFQADVDSYVSKAIDDHMRGLLEDDNNEY